MVLAATSLDGWKGRSQKHNVIKAIKCKKKQLQRLQADRQSGANIQFYLNNVTNLHQLTSQRTTTSP